MKFKNIFLGAFLVYSSINYGQTDLKKVLFKINDTPYYTDEFVRIYKKNLDLVKDESQKDLNNYLDLFVGYKLKVQKAEKLGLQNADSYKTELLTHRNQLAKNYLVDSEVTQALVEEAYQRSLYEVNASHILLMLDENASDEEVKKVYAKALSVYEEAVKAKDFSDVAKKYSEDPSVKDNGGALGYFSAFRMVYPFETAAYTTAVGQISKPVRSKFGYHIVKVNDKRANRGEVTVGHIMIYDKKGAEGTVDAKQTINELYTKLKNGESFETLAKEHSEDQSSNAKGGMMQPFSSGDISIEIFEDKSFGLKNKGDFSEPFESKFGWHIVKLINKQGPKQFEEVKKSLEDKIGRDSRSVKVKESFQNKLKAKYTITKDQTVYQNLIKQLGADFTKDYWEYSGNKALLDKQFATIDKKDVLKVNDFVKYLSQYKKTKGNIKSISKFVDGAYQEFINEEMVKYYDNNLENEFDSFKNIVQEYREGLLLFDLIEKEIWEKAKSDSLSLQKYYENNKGLYTWKKRYDLDIFSTKDEKQAKAIVKALKKNKTIDQIKALYNTGQKVEVMVRSDKFEFDNPALPVEINSKKKINDIVKKNEYYYVVRVNDIKEEMPKTFEEAHGKLVSDYQNYLEEHWVANLKKEFDVQVNHDVLEQVKQSL